jgi:hypothetical protein
VLKRGELDACSHTGIERESEESAFRDSRPPSQALHALQSCRAVDDKKIPPSPSTLPFSKKNAKVNVPAYRLKSLKIQQVQSEALHT